MGSDIGGDDILIGIVTFSSIGGGDDVASPPSPDTTTIAAVISNAYDNAAILFLFILLVFKRTTISTRFLVQASFPPSLSLSFSLPRSEQRESGIGTRLVRHRNLRHHQLDLI